MELIVNGKEQQLDNDKLNIKEILLQNDVKEIEMVSVQLNGQFVNKTDFTSTLVKNNDSIDFLFFMGGGSLGMLIDE